VRKSEKVGERSKTLFAKPSLLLTIQNICHHMGHPWGSNIPQTHPQRYSTPLRSCQWCIFHPGVSIAGRCCFDKGCRRHSMKGQRAQWSRPLWRELVRKRSGSKAYTGILTANSSAGRCGRSYSRCRCSCLDSCGSALLDGRNGCHDRRCCGQA
jgi:hypothetical protein